MLNTLPADHHGAAGAPDHLLIGPRTHGVTRYAGEVAAAAGARVIRDVDGAAASGSVHFHVTDRLLGRDPAAAATAVELLARQVRLTITLHDVPQPTDGPVFGARTAAYRRMVRASHAWVTNSRHERTLIDRWCDPPSAGAVIPLPVFSSTGPMVDRVRVAREPVLGVFGFVYPGKGHRQVVRAAAALRRSGAPARVRVLGGAAPGHTSEVADLLATSRARGVPVEVTGRVPERAVTQALRRIDVPVVAHRNVSASGSLNSWIAAGRRPLVRDGAYAREMDELRPDTIRLFDDSTLVQSLELALLRPDSTWIPPGTGFGPGLEDIASAYRAWWSTVSG